MPQKIELGSVWCHRSGITGKVVENPLDLSLNKTVALLVEGQMHLSIRPECLLGDADDGGVLGGWFRRTPSATALETAGLVQISLSPPGYELLWPEEAHALGQELIAAAIEVESA